MTEFVSRAQWGAAPSEKPLTSMTKALGVTCHYEGVNLGAYSHDTCAKRVRNIQRVHQNGEYIDIAYNDVVCRHGVVFEGRGLGKQSGANGTTAANKSWYAICILMGPDDDLTVEACEGFLAARKRVMERANVGSAVVPHSKHVATQCPGKKLSAWIAAGMPMPTVAKPASLEEATKMIGNPAVSIAATPTGKGYYILAKDGAVFSFGDAKFLGGRGGPDQENAPFVKMVCNPTGGGYWLFCSDGGVFAYGDAQFYGTPAEKKLNEPIVDASVTPDGGGYYLVAADGGVFNYGNAEFHGAALEYIH